MHRHDRERRYRLYPLTVTYPADWPPDRYQAGTTLTYHLSSAAERRAEVRRHRAAGCGTAKGRSFTTTNPLEFL